MRMRRIRNSKILRHMTRETSLDVSDLIYPLFVIEGEDIYREIPSLPDNYHISVDRLPKVIDELIDLGIHAVILFGIPGTKDAVGTSGFVDDGIIQRAVRKIKSHTDDMVVITDVCMCEYTDHGHCGILDEDGNVLNDETVEYLKKIALSHARAGADIVAPSDMMDLRIKGIREALDAEGFVNIPIMAYSAKYASSYYGPFRDAAGSAPSKGDRKSYQMDYHNAREAMREVEADVEEGADFIIVKPTLAYLDILYQTRQKVDLPIVAYNVSGEYSMLKEAVALGLLGEEVIYETLISMKRAGADMIITYHAKEIAKKLKEEDY